MPFEKGNVLGRSKLYVTETLRRAVLAGDMQKLRRACDAVLDRAAEGDLQSLAWIADRLEGKAVARIETDAADTRSLTLSDVASLILQARSATATDAVHAARAALPSAAGGGGEGDIPVNSDEGGGGV